VEAFNRQRVEDTTSSNMLLTEPFARTSREIDQFAVKIQDETARLEIRQVELKAIRSQVYSGIEELNGIDSKVQVIASSLPILRQKIKTLPQILPAGSNSLEGAGKELAVPLFTEGTASGKIIGIVSYGSNPLYLDLSKQINQQEVEQEMLLQRKTQLEALIKKGKLDIKNLGRECNDMTLKIANLQRQLSVRQKTYDVLSNSLSETELSGRFNVSNVRVFSLAGQAYPLSYFFAFVFGGIVLGAFIAFVVFYFQLSSAGTIAVEYRQTGRSV
jgi:chromosome segregation ATPase